MSSPQSPQELFNLCVAREEEIKKLQLDQLRIAVAKERAFPPLFDNHEMAPSDLSHSDEKSERIQRAILLGNRYRDLVQLLRSAGDRDVRFIVLGQWLRQEKVCEPEDLLPQDLLKKLETEIWKGLRRDDVERVGLIDAWLPYFQRLIIDRELLEQQGVRRVAEAMEKQGYQQAAVALVISKRSPFEAVYSWLHARKHGSVETFRNVRARFRSTANRLTPDSFAEVFGRELEEIPEGRRTSELLTEVKASQTRRSKKSK